MGFIIYPYCILIHHISCETSKYSSSHTDVIHKKNYKATNKEEFQSTNIEVKFMLSKRGCDSY